MFFELWRREKTKFQGVTCTLQFSGCLHKQSLSTSGILSSRVRRKDEGTHSVPEKGRTSHSLNRSYKKEILSKKKKNRFDNLRKGRFPKLFFLSTDFQL